MKILNESNENFEILLNELINGNPIIIPTDTNYNLCSLPNDKKCIDKIFEYKERNKDKPLSLFIADPYEWNKYGLVENETIMKRLIDKFWPGSLNIIIKNHTNYNYMLNGNKNIALGCVKNKTMRNFIKYIGSPLSITSANISGTANDLLVTEEIAIEHMNSKINYMLKSSYENKCNSSSTIISLLNNKIKLIREGDIKFDLIKKEIVDEVVYD